MRFDSNPIEFKRISLITMGLVLAGLAGAPAVSAQEGPGSEDDGAEASARESAANEESAAQKESSPEQGSTGRAGEGSSAEEAGEKTAQDGMEEEELGYDELGYDELSAQAAQAYRAGDYARASELFQRAYAIKAKPNLLYNIGRAEERAGNFDAAVEQYQEFVTKPGVDIKPRQEALARLKVLREVAELNKSAAEEEPEEVAEEQPSSAEQEASATMEEQPPPPEIERDYTYAWVSFGVAAASYITSGVFAWQTRQAHQDFNSATSRKGLRDAADWGQTSSIIADSTLGLGAVLTGVGVYFLLSPIEREVPSDARSGRLSPQVGPGEVGLGWAISF